MKIQKLSSLNIDRNGLADVVHIDPRFPVSLFLEELENYTNYAIRWHWHPQPEFIVPAVPSATDAPVIQDSGELTDDTIVYAVTNNAASYHLFEICDQQENRRALTLRDALNEGLKPCEKCVGAMG